MIDVRPVESEADIDVYLDVRNRVHPQTPMPREWVTEQRQKPDNLDLLAALDGVPVGVATVSKFGGDAGGELAYTTIRVLEDSRRHGVGSALFAATSAHARTLGKSATMTVVRVEDADSLAFYRARGFEIGRAHV